MATKSVNRLRWPAPVLPWEEARACSARALAAAERMNALFDEMVAGRIAAREAAEKAAVAAAFDADAEADEAEARELHARQEAEQRLCDHNIVVAWLESQLEAAWKRQAELESELDSLRGYPRQPR